MSDHKYLMIFIPLLEVLYLVRVEEASSSARYMKHIVLYVWHVSLFLPVSLLLTMSTSNERFSVAVTLLALVFLVSVDKYEGMWLFIPVVYLSLQTMLY